MLICWRKGEERIGWERQKEKGEERRGQARGKIERRGEEEKREGREMGMRKGGNNWIRMERR